MSDGSLTQDEIDAILSGIDREHEKRNLKRKKRLIKDAINPREIVKAVRDSCGAFTLSDEEAENLILRYARRWNRSSTKNI